MNVLKYVTVVVVIEVSCDVTSDKTTDETTTVEVKVSGLGAADGVELGVGTMTTVSVELMSHPTSKHE